MSIESLLMQAGYYTIRAVLPDETVVLGYPNREVAVSMAQLYAEELLQGQNLRNVCPTPAMSVLSSGAPEAVVSYFTEVLRAIDYQRYPVKDEATCRGYLQVLLIGAKLAPLCCRTWKFTMRSVAAIWRWRPEIGSGFLKSNSPEKRRRLTASSVKRSSKCALDITGGKAPGNR